MFNHNMIKNCFNMELGYTANIEFILHNGKVCENGLIFQFYGYGERNLRLFNNCQNLT